MMSVYHIFKPTKLKKQIHCLSFFIVFYGKFDKNKTRKSTLKPRKQKQMLDVTKKYYPQIALLQSCNQKKKDHFNVKLSFHMSSKYNKQIDTTQNTNEEDGGKAIWGERKGTKLHTKLPKPY